MFQVACCTETVLVVSMRSSRLHSYESQNSWHSMAMVCFLSENMIISDDKERIHIYSTQTSLMSHSDHCWVLLSYILSLVSSYSHIGFHITATLTTHNSSDTHVTIQISACLADISSMASHYLKLNTSKTEMVDLRCIIMSRYCDLPGQLSDHVTLTSHSQTDIIIEVWKLQQSLHLSPRM